MGSGGIMVRGCFRVQNDCFITRHQHSWLHSYTWEQALELGSCIFSLPGSAAEYLDDESSMVLTMGVQFLCFSVKHLAGNHARQRIVSSDIWLMPGIRKWYEYGLDQTKGEIRRR